MAEEKNDGFDPCFFVKVLRGFLDEMEEEEKKQREERRKNRRNNRGNYFCDMDMSDLFEE